MSGNEILKISDGAIEINLLSGIDVVYLDPDGGYRPALAQWKGGGTWQDSPLSDGRRLVNRQFGNSQDAFNIIAGDLSQDALIFGLQELFRLLEKAAQYWYSDWQNEPVWIEQRADCETNIRYSIIQAWSIPELDDPHKPPFKALADQVAMEGLSLVLEHAHWMSYEPGSELCVEISGKQLRYETEGTDTAAPTANSDDGYVEYREPYLLLGNSVLFGKNATVPIDGVVRVIDVAVPQGAQITDAYLTFRADANNSADMDVVIFCEDSMTPATFTTVFNDYITRPVTTNRVRWAPIEAWVAGNDYDSPDLSELIQELVDNPSWSSGNDIAFFIRENGSTGQRSARDNDSGGGPVLTVSYVTGTEELGRDETCDEEVFIANKHNRGQITHIFIEDGGVFGGNLLGSGVPYNLLPNPTANGDRLYFGSDTSHEYGGPFCSLVFDIANPVAVAGPIGVGNFIDWTYSDGVGGWNNLGVANIPEITDHTYKFCDGGVQSWSWRTPTDWAAQAVNGVTAYWIRGTISGAVANNVQQQNRDVYSCLWGNVELAADQVAGDIAALMQGVLRNWSDSQGEYIESSHLDLHADRAILGLRSYDRGADWQAYINISDIQNPPTVTVDDLEGPYAGVMTTRPEAPSGRASIVTPPVAGLSLEERVRVRFSPELATQYYGKYHMFVRVAQISIGSGTGDRGDFTVQLKIASGQKENIIFTSDTYTLENIADTAGADRIFFEPMDIGEVDLRPGDGVTQDTQNLYFNLWASAEANATPGTLAFYDLVFIPIDEWAADFSNSQNTRGAQLQFGQLQRTLDFGSHNYKRFIEALLQTENLVINWLSIANSPAILQANARQKLCLFTMAHIPVFGDHDGGNGLAYFSEALEDFVDEGVQAGDIIYNISDGSSATVTGVGGTNNREIYGTLSGGDENDWDNNDVAVILTQKWESQPTKLHTLQLYKQQRYLGMRGAR